jgi:hypothetical protein
MFMKRDGGATTIPPVSEVETIKEKSYRNLASDSLQWVFDLFLTVFSVSNGHLMSGYPHWSRSSSLGL